VHVVCVTFALVHFSGTRGGSGAVLSALQVFTQFMSHHTPMNGSSTCKVCHFIDEEKETQRG